MAVVTPPAAPAANDIKPNDLGGVVTSPASYQLSQADVSAAVQAVNVAALSGVTGADSSSSSKVNTSALRKIRIDRPKKESESGSSSDLLHSESPGGATTAASAALKSPNPVLLKSQQQQHNISPPQAGAVYPYSQVPLPNRQSHRVPAYARRPST